jgi:hypothetical protein
MLFTECVGPAIIRERYYLAAKRAKAWLSDALLML